jgi:hypothetical protein
MSDTDDILLDRLIASLREVQNLKGKPKRLKIEIAGLEATRDAVRAELEQVRKELNDPSLNKQRQELEARIRREIKDRESELSALIDRVAVQRVELDRLQSLCKEKLDYHDQILDSVDSLRKQIGVAVDPSRDRISKAPVKKEITGWDYVAERENQRQAEQRADVNH